MSGTKKRQEKNSQPPTITPTVPRSLNVTHTHTDPVSFVIGFLPSFASSATETALSTHDRSASGRAGGRIGRRWRFGEREGAEPTEA